jgi:MoaA/NifB/PqqE/SkfB family radical SAM enzyme
MRSNLKIASEQRIKMNPLDFASSLRYRLLYLFRFWQEKGFRATYNFTIARVYWATGVLQNLLLKRLAPIIQPYPCLIEVEPTTRCNLKCRMCEHTYWREPQRDMSFKEFKKIIDQFPHLKWIGLTGIGSSFLNKDFMKMLQYVKSKKIYVEIYDTFFLINREKAKELINLGIDRILPSIDAATKETYEKIRVGSDFETVVRNLKNLIEIKKERNLIFPELSFHYIISKLNMHEVVKFIDFVHSIDPTAKKIAFTTLLHPFKEVQGDYLLSVPEKIIQEAERRGKELGIRIGWNFNVRDEKCRPLIGECTFWIIPFIFATGHVIICCAGNEANSREFQKKYSFGNILEKPFREIWNSEEYKKARKLIRQGICPMQCRGCPSFNTSSKTKK